MSFLYPLGFIALALIPILVIIYIIKNTYTEQVISSTYLWTLSERFLKRKNPLRRITGILSLILQILIVVMITFSLVQPTFTLYGAAHDYMFIIDGSGSMNIAASDGTTRLDEAKAQITDIVDDATNGSTYTLVYAAETTSTLLDSSDDKDRVTALLNQIDGGYCAANLTGALSAAQEKFTANPSLKIYLFTDKDFEGASSNFTVVNLSSGEENYAVSDVSYTVTDGGITVTGNAWSYESDATLNVSLYIDGDETAYDTKTVEVTRLTAGAFEFTGDITYFNSLTVAVEESDGLLLDNECTVYSLTSDSTYNTLIVYDSSADQNNVFFLKSALSSFGEVQITVQSSTEYTGESGYGLYIFDNYVPDTMPADGAVWYINPYATVDNMNFRVNANVSLEDAADRELTYSTSTSSRITELLSGTTWGDSNGGSGIYVSAYMSCSYTKNFYTILSYGSSPVLFAGTNGKGNREVVFAFDLHDSDFVLTTNYLQIMYNLFNYTFPEIVDSTSYYCGDTVAVNVLSGCTSIRVDTPLGNISYLDTSGDYAQFTADEAGTYTITLLVSGITRYVNIYVALPLEERYTSVTVSADGAVYSGGSAQVAVLSADGNSATEVSFNITGEAQDGSRDGYFSDLWVWIVALAVLFIADWGVYCYEQYQLR